MTLHPFAQPSGDKTVHQAGSRLGASKTQARVIASGMTKPRSCDYPPRKREGAQHRCAPSRQGLKMSWILFFEKTPRGAALFRQLVLTQLLQPVPQASLQNRR